MREPSHAVATCGVRPSVARRGGRPCIAAVLALALAALACGRKGSEEGRGAAGGGRAADAGAPAPGPDAPVAGAAARGDASVTALPAGRYTVTYGTWRWEKESCTPTGLLPAFEVHQEGDEWEVEPDVLSVVRIGEGGRPTEVDISGVGDPPGGGLSEWNLLVTVDAAGARGQVTWTEWPTAKSGETKKGPPRCQGSAEVTVRFEPGKGGH